MAGTDAHLSLAGGAPLTCGLSKCRNVGLAGANAHGLVDVEHKYLPVPDLPSLRGRSDGLDGVVDQLARHRYLDLDLDLRQEGHCPARKPGPATVSVNTTARSGGSHRPAPGANVLI